MIPFELGKVHRGDCLELMKQLPNKCIDLVLTDPPYGHNNNNDMIANWEAIYGGKNKIKKVPESEYRPIENDGPEANDIFKLAIAEYKRLLKPGCCCCCCCGGGGPDPQFARWSLWLDEQIPFKMMVVWDKGPIGMGHHYRRSYETVLVAQQPGAACKWLDTSNKIENIIRPNYKNIRKIIPSKNQHPTVKPVELMEHFIRLHTEPDDIVLDPFAGSGTTGVACVKTGRRFLGFELDPEYCKLANDRIQSAEQNMTLNEYRQGQGGLF